MDKLTLFHGSEEIIEKPDLTIGNWFNDYGRGFYCTEEEAMAGEWACRNKRDGYINQYQLKLSNLKILDLTDEKYSILNWIALLLENRRFRLDYPVAKEARNYIIENYLPTTKGIDIIKGYRADDSYFQYAEAFVENALSLRLLERAMNLGDLGIQIAIMTPKAVDQLKFIDAKSVLADDYYSKFKIRDDDARKTYKKLTQEDSLETDIYVMDIIRGEVKTK